MSFDIGMKIFSSNRFCKKNIFPEDLSLPYLAMDGGTKREEKYALVKTAASNRHKKCRDSSSIISRTFDQLTILLKGVVSSKDWV